MFGKPGLPKVIPIALQVIGWLFIVWFIVNFVNRILPPTTIDKSSYHAWFHSMMYLHFILGVVLILNGLALHRIITSVEKATDYIAVELEKRSS